jgi:thiol-disulfide isomerase/thioredoxin
MKDRNRSAGVVIATTLSAAIVAAIVVFALLRSRHPSPQLQNASYAPTIGAAQVGKPAPEFKIPTTDGTFDLDKQTRPVLLEVFATWCPHCQHETAVMKQLYRSFGSRVSFIAVPGSTTAMDGVSPESEEDVFAFMQRFDVHYPTAIYDPTLTVANQYIQGGFPTLAVIGKNKNVLYLTSGETPYNTLAAQLKKALASS